MGIRIMKIGYARISRPEQNIQMQIDCLQAEGCSEIFTDTCTGKNTERVGLNKALDFARAEDTLVVWKLDRFGRSLKHLIHMMARLDEKKIKFKSLQESIDTSTPGGKLIFHMFSAIAEFEYDIIKERTEAGVIAARARGRKGGRPYVMTNIKDIKQMIEIYQEAKISVSAICRVFKISRPSFYNYLKRFKTSEAALPQQSQ